jgi:hypothetical protein
MATQSAAAAMEPVELDLLQHVSVIVPCAACRQHYTVTLRDVLMSQDMMHEGCPVYSETECLPLTYAALADEAAVREFEHSWIQVLRKVRTAGFDLSISRPILSH